MSKGQTLCTVWKVLSQGIHICNMKALSLLVRKLWPRLKFFKSRSNFKVKVTRSTRGPRAFYRSPDNQQQTVQLDKRQPEWQDLNKCMCCRQYISMLLWTFGLKEDFVKGEALTLPIFAPSWIYPLEYLAETTTRMAAFQVEPFVFEALIESFLPCLVSNPGRIW